MHSTSRLGLNIPDGSDNESAFPTVSNQQMTTLDASVVEFSGTLSNRSSVVSSPQIGFDYYATDTKQWFRYNGSAWQALRLIPVSTSTSTTAVDGQELLVTGSSAITITLPSHASGQMVGVTNYSSGGTTVSGTLIQGLGLSSASSFPLGAVGAHAILLDDGTNWNLIAGQQDTGYLAMTLGSGVNSIAGYTPAARLVGNMVELCGTLHNNSGTTLAAFTTMATLPAAIGAPAQEVLWTAPALTGNATSVLFINGSTAIENETTMAANLSAGIDGWRFRIS